MNLKHKNVIIIIGPTQNGKSTLISALNGQKMKLMDQNALKNYP